jgi:hypothetical protein
VSRVFGPLPKFVTPGDRFIDAAGFNTMIAVCAAVQRAHGMGNVQVRLGTAGLLVVVPQAAPSAKSGGGGGPSYSWAEVTALSANLTTLTVRLLDEQGQPYGDEITITPDGFADNAFVTTPNLRMVLPAAVVGSAIRVENCQAWPAQGWRLWDRNFPAQHWVRVQALGGTTFTARFLEPGADPTPNAQGAAITVQVWAAGLDGHSRAVPLGELPFLAGGQDVLVSFRVGPYAGWWYQGPAPWTCTG